LSWRFGCVLSTIFSFKQDLRTTRPCNICTFTRIEKLVFYQQKCLLKKKLQYFVQDLSNQFDIFTISFILLQRIARVCVFLSRIIPPFCFTRWSIITPKQKNTTGSFWNMKTIPFFQHRNYIFEFLLPWENLNLVFFC